MNVTDSLDAIEGYVRAARRTLAPVLAEPAWAHGYVVEMDDLVHGLVAETVVILDDTIDRIAAERRALDEAAKLLRHKACSQCGREFDFVQAPGRDPIYCSASCRQAAYRGRAARRS